MSSMDLLQAKAQPIGCSCYGTLFVKCLAVLQERGIPSTFLTCPCGMQF